LGNRVLGCEETTMTRETALAKLIRRYFEAYELKDREAIEPLLAEDFHFSSPLDDHISRAVYFERCWPNSERIRAFHIERLFGSFDEAFVLYELEPVEGKRFRNTEFFKTREGKITEVQVYFGATEGTAGDSARG
jgi:ketosteroid isomerase-like protein